MSDVGIKAKTRSLAFILLFVVATTTALGACSQEEQLIPSQPQVMPVHTEPQQVLKEPQEATTPQESVSTEPRSLVSVATEDAEKYMDALKKKDYELLSLLMAYAENENTPETIKVIVEGFQLYFDHLADLKLSFDFNQQSDEYFIENFVITGRKNGQTRSIPFQVKYYKNGELPPIQVDDHRMPLYDSPLINQFPYMIWQAEKYLQALLEEDVESLILLLGLYDTTEEDKSVIRKLLKAYCKQLDLTTTKIVPVNYDENNKVFLFDYQDDKERSHSIQIDSNGIIIDEWVSE